MAHLPLYHIPLQRQIENFYILHVEPALLHQIVNDDRKLAKGEWTPLHYACFDGNFEIVKFLVETKKHPVDAANFNKNTPFHVACARGNAQVAQYLLGKGASAKSKDNNGWTTLHYATYGGNPEIVNELFKRGAKAKVKSKIGWNPLHCAGLTGATEAAEILFTKGITKSVNDKDQLRNTPLHYACGNGHVKLVEIFIAKGASVFSLNDIAQTPLHLAVNAQSLPIIQILLKNGANVDAKDEEKRAPLHYCCEKGLMEICELLITNKADVNIKDKLDWTPLHYSFNTGFVHQSILLLTKGADFCAKNNRGQIPLSISFNNRMDNFHREFIFGNLFIEPTYAPVAFERIMNVVKMNKSVDFSKAGLHGFPPGLAFASFLSSLDLSYNRITLFPSNMHLFTSLKKLSLSHNDLRVIPDHITLLPSLTSLDLSNNLLADLQQNILQLKTLVELDVSNNQLLMLPTFLANAPQLMLNIEGNPLTCIPPQIKNKGYKDILVYLKQLKDGSAIWGRMKVMLVGQEGVGKTSLLQAIQKKSRTESVSQLLSTDGIEISSFVTNKVQFRAWDFGGQLVFYPTHQFFLTRSCVYLVLFDLSKPNTLDRVEYWLQQLKCLVFEDPKAVAALIIGTHADKEGAISIEIAQRRFTSNKFPFIKGFMTVNCKPKKIWEGKAGAGVNTVVDRLVELSKDDKTFSSFVPESYINLESKLMKLVSSGVDYVEWPHFIEISKSCDINADDVPFVTRFMHDAGVLLHFQGQQAKSVFWESTGASKRHMGGVVVLNPQWLANVMATIITFSHTWVKLGILLHSDLAQVWKEKYHPDLWNLLLGLLEEFEVLYPLQNNPGEMYARKYLVPSLLPSIETTVPTPPQITSFEEIWKVHPRYNMRRVYSWDTLPVGFFPRLLLRIAHLCKWNTMGWVDGLMVTNGPHIAYLRYYEGLAPDGTSPSPKGIFHLDIRVVKNLNEKEKPQTDLAPMLAQLSHSICALRDTAYHQYQCFSIIYCPLCLGKLSENPHPFTYKECMDSMLYNTNLTCETCKTDIPLEQLAPDIAFANVPHIKDGLEMGDIIGSGGFGKVFKGKLTTEDGVKEVAIKEAIGLSCEEDFQMLQHEVFLMSTISHPNLVAFYGIARQPTMQIIMEFVPGNDLSKVLYSNSLNHIYPPIAWQLRVAYDVACAMQYLHNLTPPITHRDLRSPNVLILNQNAESPVVAKVIDLGLAQQLAPMTYGGLETWQWMAPETILPTLKTAYTEKCDVYSFAIVAWEIVAQGKLPFEEHVNQHVLHVKERIVKQGLRPVIPPTCPEDFGRLIHDCWQGDPNLRPSFNQVVFALEKMITGRNISLEASRDHTTRYSIGSPREFMKARPERDLKTAPPKLGEEGAVNEAQMLERSAKFSTVTS